MPNTASRIRPIQELDASRTVAIVNSGWTMIGGLIQELPCAVAIKLSKDVRLPVVTDAQSFDCAQGFAKFGHALPIHRLR